MGLLKLSDKEFRKLSELVYAQCGIILGEHKRSLVVGRLNKELKQKGFESFMEYYEYVTHDPTGQALNTLIEKISTNHTFFWRENDHFDFFTNTVLPEEVALMRQRKSRDLRIWCAGCSTGEEPYTLAMLVREYFGRDLRNWDAGVLATDISDRVLRIATEGVYREENLKKLPPRLRNDYFVHADEDVWEVREDLRKMVLFRKLNLMRENYPFKGRFQIIFCRNVMIYFDTPTRNALVQRFYRSMEPGGYLFIGHSESLGRMNCPFRYVRPAVYRKEGE
jgi:chemotaxis protein methyltransferase CheR